jgi:hypothetical protein
MNIRLNSTRLDSISFFSTFDVATVGNVSKSYADVVRGTTRQSSRVTEVVRQSPVNGKM